MTGPHSRRTALGVGAAALATLCACPALSAAAPSPSALLDSARAIGRAALAAGVTPMAADDAARLTGPTLRKRVEGDFTAGQTVVVEGWLLSRTEARYLAHIAMEGVA